MAGAGASLGLVVAQLLVGVTPALAAGGSAHVAGTTVHFVADPGLANEVTVEQTGAAFRITDNAAPVVPGAGCVAVTPNQVSCTAPVVTTIWADTADLDDTLTIRATGAFGTFYGGSGDDRFQLQGVRGTSVYGQDGNDVVFGSDAPDSIYGGPGDDRLYGYDAADLLLGGAGADLMSGGTGYDTVSYADYSSAVSADADGVVGDDGAAHEADTIRSDVEKIVGGRAADVLLGTDGDDELAGGGGDDILIGSGGDDLLLGGSGLDRLYGDSQRTLVLPVDQDICEAGSGGGVLYGCETAR